MLDELYDANRHYAERFSLAGIAPRAARGVAVVTCMDSRIEPLPMLGLVPGDAKIMRNAGGRVTPDVLRSLALAVALLEVREVIVLQHTRCAMAHTTDDELWAKLGPMAEHRQGVELWAMADPDTSLRDDVERVRTSPLLPGDLAVEGWRYDVDTGRVERLVTA